MTKTLIKVFHSSNKFSDSFCFFKWVQMCVYKSRVLVNLSRVTDEVPRTPPKRDPRTRQDLGHISGLRQKGADTHMAGLGM
jgi:hypothetical protein